MSQIDKLVENFLAQKKIAVVGVSDRRETGCNLSYRRLKQAGFQVFAVNPRIHSFEGDSCYPDLKSIPDRPDAVFIFTKPSVTEEIVHQCIDLNIKHVWMHCMMGTKPGSMRKHSSVSENAVRLCRENGIEVIPGSCPNHFLNPDFGHGMMRRLWRVFGLLAVPQNEGN